MAKLLFTDSYSKRSKKFFSKHPELINQYQKTLELLTLNPHHPSLRLHPLKEKLEGIYSVSINMSYRINIDFIIQENTIVPINIGNHDEVY